MKKRTYRKLRAGLSTYVFLLFGLTLVFYMFGFHSVWDTYSNYTLLTDEEGVNKTNITNPEYFQPGTGKTKTMFSNLGSMILAGLGLLGGGAILTFIVGRFTGGTTVYLQYLFPIVLLVVFLNVFVFPIAQITDQTQQINTVFPVSYVLAAFFNLILILAIIEFVRGTPT